MHQIQLSDQLYVEAERLARAGGFRTVDDYIEDVMGRPSSMGTLPMKTI
jgi:hypothetical protein